MNWRTASHSLLTLGGWHPDAHRALTSFLKTTRYTSILKAKNVEVTCPKKVKLEAILRIRHDSKLIIRNLW